MNKYEDALDTLCLKIMTETDQSEEERERAISILQECIKQNETLKEIIKGLRNENFVHILTNKGIKYAFQNMNQVDDFINKNNLSKVHLTSIQYYREKPLDWSNDEI